MLEQQTETVAKSMIRRGFDAASAAIVASNAAGFAVSRALLTVDFNWRHEWEMRAKD
jgi:hypothetical protein